MEKSTKIIIGVVVFLCLVLFGVTMFANNFEFTGYKDKNGWIHNEDTSVSYTPDANAGNTYALVSIDKSRLTNIDAHYYIETIAPILNGYSGKYYTTIVFDDGTGIYCPGSTINNISYYGEIDETGHVTQEFGQIKVDGTEITYIESSAIQSAESKNMYQYLPDKYRTDNGSVAVIDNELYISIGIGSRSKIEEASEAAEEVFIAFSKANLNQFDKVEIVVNNEFAFLIIDGALILE